MSLDYNPFIERKEQEGDTHLSEDRENIVQAIFKKEQQLKGIAKLKLRNKGVVAMSGEDVFLQSLERLLEAKKVTYITDDQACTLLKMKMDGVITDYWKKRYTKKRGADYIILELMHEHANQLPAPMGEEDGFRMFVEDLLDRLGERFPTVFAEIAEPELCNEVNGKDADYYLHRYHSGHKEAGHALYAMLHEDLATWLNPLFKVHDGGVMELDGAWPLLREVFDDTLSQRVSTLQCLKQRLRNATYQQFRTRYGLVPHGEEDNTNPVRVTATKAHPLLDAMLRAQIIDQLLPKNEDILCAFIAKAMGIPAVQFCKHLGVDNGKASKMVKEGGQLLARVVGAILS